MIFGAHEHTDKFVQKHTHPSQTEKRVVNTFYLYFLFLSENKNTKLFGKT